MIRTVISLLVVSGLAVAVGCGNRDAGPPPSPADQVRNDLGLPDWALAPLRTAAIRIGDVTAEVELAFGPKEQEQGLMYRTSMEEDHGMLFVYKEPDFLTFWMKNTRLPLSIAFIKTDGTIDVIRDMKPLDTSVRYHSKHQCQFALEMNQGWFSRNGVGPGQLVELPDEVRGFLEE